MYWDGYFFLSAIAPESPKREREREGEKKIEEGLFRYRYANGKQTASLVFFFVLSHLDR